jgi:hypothetical protein
MKGRRIRKERGDHHVLHFFSLSLIYPAFQPLVIHFLNPTPTPSTTSTSHTLFVVIDLSLTVTPHYVHSLSPTYGPASHTSGIYRPPRLQGH